MAFIFAQALPRSPEIHQHLKFWQIEHLQSDLVTRNRGRTGVPHLHIQRPALVLIDQGFVDSFIVNSPSLERSVKFARYHPNVQSLKDIANAFPERTIYLFNENAWQIERIFGSRSGARN